MILRVNNRRIKGSGRALAHVVNPRGLTVCGVVVNSFQDLVNPRSLGLDSSFVYLANKLKSPLENTDIILICRDCQDIRKART